MAIKVVLSPKLPAPLVEIARSLLPAEFELHQPVYRVELGPKVFEPRVVLALELLNELVELRFLGVDLLFQERRPVLQVPAYVTHCCPSFMALVPTTERAGRFTQDRTNPAWPPRPASLARSRLASAGRPH